MDETYRKSAGTAAWVFFIALLIALVFGVLHAVVLMRAALLVSYVTAFVWYFNFAKAKGYSGWWALLGFLHLIGFIIILCMPDKTSSS
jgi:hypothetical protein